MKENNDKPRKPRFLWQGILILLPLIILTSMGIYSLREEKLRAENEARERCAETAQALVDTLSKDLYEQARQKMTELRMAVNTPGSSNFVKPAWFADKKIEAYIPAPLYNQLVREWVAENVLAQMQLALDSNGTLTNVPAAQESSPNPLALSDLSPQQAQLWNAARDAEYIDGNVTNAIRACQQFIDSAPPAQFAAVAQYTLALLLAKDGQGTSAEKLLREVETNRNSTTESGLPLWLLAQLQRARLLMTLSSPQVSDSQSAPLLHLICSNAVVRPSLVTPVILESVAELETKAGTYPKPSDRWRFLWQRDEAARNFHQHLLSATPKISTGAFWTQWEQQQWLVLITPQKTVDPKTYAVSTNDSFHAYALYESLLEESVWELLIKSRTPVPPYAGISVEGAGKTIYAPPSGTGGPILASRSGMLYDQLSGLTVNVHLSNPSKLYAAQRQRTLWFAALVVASALAALIGLVNAWRGFNQQLRLNDLKSNFVSSVSHELRAPIASVRLMAEGLDHGKITAPEKQREYYRFIVQECRRLTSLIENVLDFSRIEQGRKKYTFEPTDLLSLVEQTVKLMTPYATDRQVRLELTLPVPSTPGLAANCDGLAIQQALINLIDNAIKHSKPGAEVTIGLSQRSAAVLGRSNVNHAETPAYAQDNPLPVLPTFQLWVQDHGPGIPPQEHQKIFERFYRLGSELRRETQGVGIGLALVKHIVEAHGGSVQVQSAAGQGSLFTLELPLAPKPTQNHGRE